MVLYTFSTLKHTLDFIKCLLNKFQILIQVIYIAYVVYRIVEGMGSMVGNAFLLLISGIYLLVQIRTISEFYTKKQRAQRRIIKRVVKIATYIVNIYTVILPTMLLFGSAQNQNIQMLSAVAMLLGITLSIIFDVIKLFIDKQIALIWYAMRYDIHQLADSHDFVSSFIKKRVDIEKYFPECEDQKTTDKIKVINKKQEDKKIRKADFLNKF